MTLPPIVDAHLHLWEIDRFHYPWLGDPGAEDLRWDYLVDDWRRDAEGLDVLATVHVQAEVDHGADPVEETAWLAALAASRPEAPVPTVCVGYADLRDRRLDEVLDRHAEHGIFRGIRQEAWFDPNSERADVPRENLLDDPAWQAGLARLAARGISFDLLVWSHQLEQAAGILRELPDLPVVLEHTGLPTDPDPAAREQWRQGMRRFAEQVPQAMLKISALRFVSPTWSVAELTPLVRESLEVFGPARCMLGSNFPVDKPAVGYRQLWEAYAAMLSDLSPDERAAVFAGNAATAYGIDASPELGSITT